MIANTTPVVRHSALDAAHAELGATFVSDAVRWPRAYGDAAGAAEATRSAAGLAELGPLAELLLRGPGAAAATAALAGVPLPVAGAVVQDVALGQASGEIWLLGPDEILFVAPVEPDWAATLAGTLASVDVSAIEMTGARTTLRLVGPAAPAILAELCPADTTPATMAEGDLLQAPLAGPRAFITRRDHGTDRGPVAGYTLMVARDEARYVWDALLHVGAGHGLVPVGPGDMSGGVR